MTTGIFFSDLRDPYLIRVGEYAALHRIFTEFPLKATRTEPLVKRQGYDKRWNGLANVVDASLQSLATDVEQIAPDGPELQSAPGSLCVSSGVEEMPDPVEMRARLLKLQDDDVRAQLVLAMVDPRRYDQGAREAESSRIEALEIRMKAHAAEVDAFNQDVGRCSLLAANCDPEDIAKRRGELEREDVAIQRAIDAHFALGDAVNQRLEEAHELRDIVRIRGDCGVAWRAVRDDAPGAGDATYRTPSIVTSYSEIGGVGGHNLDGRPAWILTDPNVAIGHARIDWEARILTLNPADKAKGEAAARAFEQNVKRFDVDDPRLVLRVEAALASDARPAVAFSAGALGRSAEAPPVRGLQLDFHRQSAEPVLMQLSPDLLTRARELARERGADIIAQIRGGATELAHPGPPPLAFSTHNPIEFNQALEKMVEYAAEVRGTSASEIVVVSDGPGFSFGDFIALKNSAASRPGAGGGGIGKIPNDGVVGAIFPSGRGPGGFDGTGRAGPQRRILAFFGSGRRADPRLLLRRDVEWGEATIEPSLSGETAYLRMTIPFKTVETEAPQFLSIVAQAIFRNRKPAEADLALMKEISEQERKAGEAAVWEKVLSIRERYVNELKGVDHIRFEVQAGDQDFHVVEKDAGGREQPWG